jgi:2-methylisocitrate lyase-like PEP mutase family enzyme
MTMSAQHLKAQTFRSLHVGGAPLVLFNIWNAGSAKAVVSSGARAIATGSWSVAAANGFTDGEKVPLELAIDNLARITAVTDLPVTVDLESGYGETADEVAHCVLRAIQVGAVGCNLEDSFPKDGSLREVHDQGARIASARKVAGGLGFFINARTDVFLRKPAAAHDDAMVRVALDRAHIYLRAGADGLFIPGVIDDMLIKRLVQKSPLPVNVMVERGTPPLSRLSELGVARVSHGPDPYRAMMNMLSEAARLAMRHTVRLTCRP